MVTRFDSKVDQQRVAKMKSMVKSMDFL